MDNDTKYLVANKVPYLIDHILGQLLAVKPSNPQAFIKDLLDNELKFISAEKSKAGKSSGAEDLIDDGKYVYLFSAEEYEGDASMKHLLGGKGANLAEMAKLKCPVPPGFTITTKVCALYNTNNKSFTAEMKNQIESKLKRLEQLQGKKFGDPTNPMLLSVRSGAAVSMPGMMDTVLNLGLSDKAVEGLSKLSSERFAWDSYRRFIAMFGNVVKGVDGEHFEHNISEAKKSKGVKLDNELSAEDLKAIVAAHKKTYESKVKEPFPQDPWVQLWAAMNAVFDSWNNPRAIKYRELNDIKGLLGTAVNVQTMVFGNMGLDSATGVCFSRNPSTGENKFYGEWLINAQGEDVVAGIRTPQQISKEASIEWARQHGISEEQRKKDFPSLEEAMPELYRQLCQIKDMLEKHYTDMQDMEFTIERNKLYMLQTRNGKRTIHSQVNIAVDMVKEGLINEKTALKRITAAQLDQLLHPTLDPKAKISPLAKGLPASPGAAVGKIVFTAKDAEEWAARNEKVLLVRLETSPEDITGMVVCQGILTARGGMTSHAAVVARGMGRPCVAGCGDLIIVDAKTCSIKNKTFREGDWLTLNGDNGEIMEGQVPLVEPAMTGNFKIIMDWAAQFRKLKVRTNADTPRDAVTAIRFGAEGVGLCRTEHMFFEKTRIEAVREMILSTNFEGRTNALKKLLPMQRQDFIDIITAMDGRPVTVRLLDPPLHEFVPHLEQNEEISRLATIMKMTETAVRDRIKALHESNPMLGHRGCRLGITFPEIYDMQVRAILEASVAVKKKGVAVAAPEIMIPLVGKLQEFTILRKNALAVAKSVFAESGTTMEIHIGTMIEVPRAAVTAGEIATEAEFFSFGTNDLTQMGCGFSRDDSGAFLGDYVKQGIYDKDPFQVLDQEGVGKLMRMAVSDGRATRPGLKCGICGEHGGEANTVKFCHKIGLNYVSCSPYRVPIAMLAAAQAAIEDS